MKCKKIVSIKKETPSRRRRRPKDAIFRDVIISIGKIVNYFIESRYNFNIILNKRKGILG